MFDFKFSTFWAWNLVSTSKSTCWEKSEHSTFSYCRVYFWPKLWRPSCNWPQKYWETNWSKSWSFSGLSFGNFFKSWSNASLNFSFLSVRRFDSLALYLLLIYSSFSIFEANELASRLFCCIIWDPSIYGAYSKHSFISPSSKSS